jgi:hypothetical protein
MKLVNVYKELMPFDMEDPTSRSEAPYKGNSIYLRLRRIERNPEAPKLTLEDLQKYLEGLRARMKAKYGDEVANLFYIGKRTVNGKTYIVLGRKRKKASNLKASDRLPIYFDLESGEAYIPETYAKKGIKRTRFLLMTVLGALNQIKRTYIGEIAKKPL